MNFRCTVLCYQYFNCKQYVAGGSLCTNLSIGAFPALAFNFPENLKAFYKQDSTKPSKKTKKAMQH